VFELVSLNIDKRSYEINYQTFPGKFKKFFAFNHNVYRNYVNAFGTGVIYIPRYTKDKEKELIVVDNE